MGFSMKRRVGKVAVVTGHSSGCGALAVNRLLKENFIIAGIAQRKDRVQALSELKNLHALQADVTKEEELLEAFKWVQENLGPMHILFNCTRILRMRNYLDPETKF
ncbi:hypothetical protein FQA39_LY03755 [Lamprigera yunnana]|nr:hypothetical protein FQA39_LY03755 [Lamprigera yunnana]